MRNIAVSQLIFPKAPANLWYFDAEAINNFPLVISIFSKLRSFSQYANEIYLKHHFLVLTIRLIWMAAGGGLSWVLLSGQEQREVLHATQTRLWTKLAGLVLAGQEMCQIRSMWVIWSFMFWVLELFYLIVNTWIDTEMSRRHKMSEPQTQLWLDGEKFPSTSSVETAFGLFLQYHNFLFILTTPLRSTNTVRSTHLVVKHNKRTKALPRKWIMNLITDIKREILTQIY